MSHRTRMRPKTTIGNLDSADALVDRAAEQRSHASSAGPPSGFLGADVQEGDASVASWILGLFSDGALVIDLGDSQIPLRIAQANSAAARLYGRALSRLVGASTLDLIGVTSETDVQARLAALHPGETTLLKGWTQRADEAQSPVELYCYRLDSSRRRLLLAVGRDMSGNEVAEQNLRRSQEELRLTLNATSDGIWKWNLKTGEMSFSSRYYEMLGYTPGEVPSSLEAWTELIHPADRPGALAVIRRFLTLKSDRYENEFRLRTKTGDFRWLRSRASVVEWDERGNPVRTIGNHEDITDRKRAAEEIRKLNDSLEERIARRTLRLRATIAALQAEIAERERAQDALQKSERRFRSLIENVVDGITLLSADGRVMYASPGGNHIMRTRPGEWCGRSIVDDLHPDDVSRFQTVMAECLRRPGVSIPIELRVCDRSGEWHDVETTHTNLLSDPSVAAIVGNCRDVTDRKRMERALRESESLLRGVFDNAPFEFWVRDKAGRVVMQNAVSHAFWGDLLGRRVEEAGVGEEVTATWQANNERAFAGETVRREVTYAHDGKVRYFDSIVAPIRVDGAVAGIFGFNIDVTDRKRAEDMAGRHRDDLIRMARLTTVGELGTMIAHELNQPLFAILNYAEACLHAARSGTRVTASVREDLHKLIAQAERVAGIIRRLGDLARKRITHRSTVNIGDLINDVVVLVEPQLHLAEVGFTIHAGAGLPPLLIDRLEIEQVLLNLVRNAVDAVVQMPAHDRQVVIETRASTPGVVEVAVSDSGAGIPADALEQIFEPCYTTKKEGIGMGLRISRSIVEAHGGRLWAERRPEGGSTLRFTLPTHSQGHFDAAGVC